MRRALIALVLCSLAFAAHTKEEENVLLYEGHWTLRGADGQAARLLISQWDGRWQETGSKRTVTDAACRGKPFPVTVHHSNATEFEFTAWGSAVAPACPDIRYSMKPVDAKTLEGTTEAGAKVRMSRAPRR
jgi:hypothetical protein